MNQVQYSRLFSFLFNIANDVLVTRGVALPLEGQSTTSPGTRFERGLAVQKAIFGAGHIDACAKRPPKARNTYRITCR